MPDLAQLTDSYVAPDDTFPVEQLYAPSVKEDAITIRPVIDAQVPARLEPRPEPMGLLDNFGMAGVEDKSGKSESKLIKKLFGLGGEERYQLWPEKVVRDALGAAGEVAQTDPTLNLGLRREDFTDIPAPSMPTKDSTWLGEKLGIAPVAAQPNDYMIDSAQSMAALAGSGGLAGTTDATLGAGPFLRPALKYEGKIYKAPLNAQHLDALPAHLQDTFHKQAMSGEDISHFNFGFMNHKGQFLSREAALDYAIKEGLVDPHAGQYGALTSTLLADSSKPGTAIEAMAKSGQPITIRGPNAEIGHESLAGLTKPGHFYRGMSEAEYNNTIGAGKNIKSNESASVPGEGTNFSSDARDAESYANYGRTDPRKTGKPNYLVEIKGSDGLKQWRDGYFKAPEISRDRVTSVIKMEPKDGSIVGTVLKADSSKPGTAIEAMAKSRYEQILEAQRATEGFRAAMRDPVTGKVYTGSSHQNAIESAPKWKEGADEVTNGVWGRLHSEWDKSTDNAGFVDNRGKFISRSEAEKRYNVLTMEDVKDLRKSKTAMFRADSSKPGAAIQAIKQPFYSALEHNVNQITQSKMTGDQWLGTLANKPGVKPEELQWTGLQEFLTENKGKPVTKEQIQEHLASNKVELKEVNKGLPFDTSEITVKRLGTENPYWESFDGSGKMISRHPGNMSEAQALEDAKKFAHLGPDVPTKYHSYQLPGGENYREKLLTLPNDGMTALLAKEKINTNRIIELRDQMHGTSGTNEIRAEIRKLQNENEALGKQIKAGKAETYKSSHWDEPNILAHVRMNDRTIEGKKSLHLEEIQSDWHQQGRDKGYKSPEKAAKAKAIMEEMKAIEKEKGGLAGGMKDARWKELDKELDKHQNDDVGVPDAPFKKSWHELALKRMIREAAEKGYDRLSWTPGEAQAARYDLSKSVDLLSAMGPDSKGKYLVYIEGKDKQPLFRNQNGFSDHGQKTMDAAELEATIGKEPAKKLMEGAAKNKNNEKTNGFFDLKDEGLKIGGEGMKGFYDQIIPKALEKIGKEHGVKVKTHVPKKVEASPEEINKLAETLYETYDRRGGEPSWKNLHPNKQQHYKDQAKEKAYLADNPEHTVHYIDLPQSLKDQAMHKGFPLFSGGYQFIPVQGDPFESKKK